MDVSSFKKNVAPLIIMAKRLFRRIKSLHRTETSFVQLSAGIYHSYYSLILVDFELDVADFDFTRVRKIMVLPKNNWVVGLEWH
jgi:hypothetical protein